MPREKGLPNLSLGSCEVILLLLRHANNELPAIIDQKVSDLIASCEACRELYHEVVEFFNETTAENYEMLYKEEVEDTRSQIERIAHAHQQELIATPDQEPFIEYDLINSIDTSCFCHDS